MIAGPRRTAFVVLLLALAGGAIGHAQSPVDALLKRAQDAVNEGRSDEAAAAAEEALARARAAGDPPAIAAATHLLGAARFFQSRLTDAIDLQRQVIATAERSGDADLLARARNSLGVALRESGEYDAGLETLLQALAHYRTRADGTEQVRVLRNIGALYLQLGDFERAESTLGAALTLTRTIGNRAYESIVLETQAIAIHLAGRPRDALELLRQALAIADALTLPGVADEISANMGRAQIAVGDPEGAIETFQRVLDRSGASGYTLLSAVLTAGIGEAYAAMGRTGEAIDQLERSRSIIAGLGATTHLNNAIEVEKHLGRALRRAGRTEEALSTYREAVAMLDRMRNAAVAGESTTASVIASRNDIVTETADLLVDLNRPEEAFGIAEQHRARTFLDVIAASRSGERPAASEAQRTRQQQLLARATELQRQLWTEPLPAVRRREVNAQISAVDEEFERLSGEIRRAGPGMPAVHRPTLLDVGAIQRQLLDDRTVLVEYLLGERRSFAWAISRRAVRTATLPPRSDIESRVASYRKLLAGRVSALTAASAERDYRRAAAELFGELVAPIEPVLSAAGRLIVVSDGALAYVPFETLRPLAAGAVSLLERFEISYVPSASVLGALAADERRPAAGGRDLFAVGDPAYDPAPGVSGRSAPAWPDVGTRFAALGVPLTPLPHSRAEVNAIGALFPRARRTLLVGGAAREDRVKAENLAAYRYLHFAAHGLLDAVSPARSGIVLGTASQSPEDGVLQTREVMTLKLDADLVVLSACETGLGRLVSAEGMMGLTRAFLNAGARGVAVSLWNVNDAATSELMQRFYSGLRRGLRGDAALRAAKLALVRGPRRAWRHPYFWAPFVLTGALRPADAVQ